MHGHARRRDTSNVKTNICCTVCSVDPTESLNGGSCFWRCSPPVSGSFSWLPGISTNFTETSYVEINESNSYHLYISDGLIISPRSSASAILELTSAYTGSQYPVPVRKGRRQQINGHVCRIVLGMPVETSLRHPRLRSGFGRTGTPGGSDQSKGTAPECRTEVIATSPLEASSRSGSVCVLYFGINNKSFSC